MTVKIPGWDAVVKWFGRWPSFHDAEILSIHLNRSGVSSLRLLVWNISDQTDAEGRFIRTHEAIVVFEFRTVRRLYLAGEDADRQNVIAGLAIEETPEGYLVDVSPSYGVAGYILARELAVRLEDASLVKQKIP